MRNYIENKIFNNHLLYRDISTDPWNPLNLPAYTIRVQLTDISYDCSNKGFNGTWTRVGYYANGTWDITYVNSNWKRLLADSIGYWGQKKTHKILGINATGVTNMERFEDCAHEYLIGTIPLFDTTALTDVTNAFYETYYIDGGQLALYQQMSSQANPPTSHGGCFRSCGLNSTDESKAETSQIPSSWK